MKLLVIILALIVPIAAQQKKSSKTPPKTSTAKKETPPPYNGPPPDAKKINATDWRWVDKQGKVWIYRRGPITWVREPEDPNAAATAQPTGAAATMTAVDKGDSVEFTRPTPVGAPARWTKKKTELDPDEKAAYEAAGKQEKK